MSMDKQDLQQWEDRCIQEQPPECVAACPLHVDARTFIRHITQGDWNGAWKVLRKTMPVPRILGRICDAPCQARCKRREAGDAIRISDLETACVSQPAPPLRILPLPGKGKTIAVVGGGISSVTLAWDLGRKGYGVRMYMAAPAPWDHLAGVYGDKVPADVMEAEFCTLSSVAVTLHPGADTGTPEFREACISGHDAVYLGLDTADGRSWDPACRPEGFFSGGLPRDGVISPVWLAAQGRWAATSIDRYLQKVSPTAGRENEGPVATRLFTRLGGVEPRCSVSMSEPGGYTREEAVQEARRCLQCQCLECVKACPFLERFKGYPRQYAREIYNNESIVMGARQANRLINSCSLCGLCQEVCPESFAMQDLCLAARQSMVARGKMPPSAHEFALLDMDFSQGENFSLARHEPGHSSSAFVFFPGCQLCASLPEKIPPLYGYLRQALDGGVGIMLGCCAAPAHWAGKEDRFQEEVSRFRETWNSLGRPVLIPACSTCFRMFRDHLPEIPVTSLWQVMAANGLPRGSSGAHICGSMAVHDPCTARREPELRMAVRELLGRLGVEVEELEFSHERTECCGFGGLMQNANPDLAAEVVRRRSGQSPLDYITYCAMCRDALAKSGKRVLHLADLVIPDDSGTDPAVRKTPTWSERRENRARLKVRLLQDVWGESMPESQWHNEIVLEISDDVADILDRRRILAEDLQQVLHHAEQAGIRLYHPETKRFKASFKHYNTTFWVEYTPSETGYVIHNAYSHRMEVVQP